MDPTINYELFSAGPVVVGIALVILSLLLVTCLSSICLYKTGVFSAFWSMVRTLASFFWYMACLTIVIYIWMWAGLHALVKYYEMMDYCPCPHS